MSFFAVMMPDLVVDRQNHAWVRHYIGLLIRHSTKWEVEVDELKQQYGATIKHLKKIRAKPCMAFTCPEVLELLFPEDRPQPIGVSFVGEYDGLHWYTDPLFPRKLLVGGSSEHHISDEMFVLIGVHSQLKEVSDGEVRV